MAEEEDLLGSFFDEVDAAEAVAEQEAKAEAEAEQGAAADPQGAAPPAVAPAERTAREPAEASEPAEADAPSLKRKREDAGGAGGGRAPGEEEKPAKRAVIRAVAVRREAQPAKLAPPPAYKAPASVVRRGQGPAQAAHMARAAPERPPHAFPVGRGADAAARGARQQPPQSRGAHGRTYVRSAGGQKWVDPTLADWPENDFRLFVGDIGVEVTDEVLANTFRQYPSFAKAKVVHDRSRNTVRCYGFVSFLDGLECLRALREMQGKYCGQRPMKLKKSTWMQRDAKEIRKRQAKDARRRQKYGLA